MANKRKDLRERDEFYRLFKKNLLTLKQCYNETWHVFSEDIGFNKNRLYFLSVRKEYVPAVIEVYKIAKFFNVSMEDLLKKIVVIEGDKEFKLIKHQPTKN